jgi:hypothetical protein
MINDVLIKIDTKPMIENLPSYISVMFALTTFLTLILFYFAVKKSRTGNSNYILAGLAVWLIIQAVLTLNNFYSTDTTSFPPRFLLTAFPALLTIVILFVTNKGRGFIDSLPLTNLTYLHVVRIPVELVLYWLFLNKAVPELMTFAGRNFDILAGITAPFVAYFGLKQQKLYKKIILVWNFIALGLLLNIVINAIFSAPFSFQKFAFDQPNIAVLYFPFSWLPAFVVPVVFFSHLVSIRQLLKSR